MVALNVEMASAMGERVESVEGAVSRGVVAPFDSWCHGSFR